MIYRLSCFTLFLLIAGTFQSYSQSVENVRASFAGGKVTVLYDLNGGQADQKYNLELFGSHNNFSSPLKMVSGDVGKNIAPGKAKRIEWNVADEMGTFKGEITFRVKGEPVAVPFSFKRPVQGGSVRKGKNASIEWAGGSVNQNVRLEILQGGQVVQSLAETKNSGAYSWQVPKYFKKGDYSLKLTSGSESVQSGGFKVKAKVPLLVKISPIIVGALVVVLLPKNTDGVQPPTEENLPDAPVPK